MNISGIEKFDQPSVTYNTGQMNPSYFRGHDAYHYNIPHSHSMDLTTSCILA